MAGLMRDMDAAFLSVLQNIREDGFYPVLMVHVDYPGSAIFAHTNLGTISYLGQSWTGVGNFGSIVIPEEESSDVPATASLSLIGTIEDVLAQLDIDARRRDATIYIGAVTEPGGNVFLGGGELFSGYVAKQGFQKTGGDSDDVAAADEFAATMDIGSGSSARASAEITHSNEAQQAIHPGDTIFRHITYAEAKRSNPDKW